MHSFRVLSRDADRNIRNQQEREQMLQHIKNDPKAIDLKISLYMAACHSHPIIELNPRPPPLNLVEEPSSNEYAKLHEINDAIPSTENLLEFLKLPEGQVLSPSTYEIVKWLTVGLKVPMISHKNPNSYEDILQIGIDQNESESAIIPVPEAIFCVNVQKSSVMGLKWAATSCQRKTGRGFLPCRVEDMHCLIYKGLIANSLDKDVPAILYTNLTQCVNEATASWAWGKSAIGTKLKIVAIVEFIEQQVEDSNSDYLPMSSSLVKLSDASLGKIKYILVYPQEKRHQQLLNQEIRVFRDSNVILQRVITVTWVVALFISSILPNMKLKRITPLC